MPKLSLRATGSPSFRCRRSRRDTHRGVQGVAVAKGHEAGVQASPGQRPGGRPGVNLSVMDLTRKRGRYCRLLADASINLEAAYLAGERNGAKELVLAVSDLQAARQVRDQGSR
jgi:hypothetical protein